MASSTFASTTFSPGPTRLAKPQRTVNDTPPTDLLNLLPLLHTLMVAKVTERALRKRSDRPRRNGGKKHRRWNGGPAGQGRGRSGGAGRDAERSDLAGSSADVSGEARGCAAGGDTTEFSAVGTGTAALTLKAAMAVLPSKLGWSSDGWLVLRGVRDKKLVRNVSRLCDGLDDDTFEVMFNHLSLEELLAAGFKYPTDLPTGGRFMRKFGGRAPAPLANLPSRDFHDWISMHKVADDMLYIISLGLGHGSHRGEQDAGVVDGGGADCGAEVKEGVENPVHEAGDGWSPSQGVRAVGGGARAAAGVDDTAVIKGEPYVMLGPTLLRSKGECPHQLMHVDNVRPSQMTGTNVPKLSLLMAVQDGTKVDVFSASHRCLPSTSGGCLTQPIPCTTVILDAGDVLIFRQDLVHRGAASTGLCHRWHWYADTGRQVSKKSTFYVLPFNAERVHCTPPARRRSSRQK